MFSHPYELYMYLGTLYSKDFAKIFAKLPSANLLVKSHFICMVADVQMFHLKGNFLLLETKISNKGQDQVDTEGGLMFYLLRFVIF